MPSPPPPPASSTAAGLLPSRPPPLLLLVLLLLLLLPLLLPLLLFLLNPIFSFKFERETLTSHLGGYCLPSWLLARCHMGRGAMVPCRQRCHSGSQAVAATWAGGTPQATSGKAAEFGPLKDGYMFESSTGLCRMLLGSPTCPVLEALGKKLSFETAIGLNGRVWVNASSPKTIIAVANAIMNSESLSAVQQRIMVEKLMQSPVMLS
ncbi:hypothetical protein Taro_027733 [Colocasia esculenta]|uniref:K Homology domain-containing protein n=1 Tax=Colocasia esculenta TaxID=4460 RepID=A0A843VFC4_COLES|nr:hypothetical protein [Colocasia esculenta]